MIATVSMTLSFIFGATFATIGTEEQAERIASNLEGLRERLFDKLSQSRTTEMTGQRMRGARE